MTTVGTAASTGDDLTTASAASPQLLTPTSMLGTSEPATTNQLCGTLAYKLLCAQLPWRLSTPSPRPRAWRSAGP